MNSWSEESKHLLLQEETTMKLDSYSHGFGQSAYHFVFVPKYRYNIFQYPSVRKKCREFFCEIAQEHGFKIHALEMGTDHLHLFVELRPDVSVSKAIQLLKGGSAFKLFRQFPFLRRWYRRGHFWSAGKFFRSIGNVTADTVEMYIKQSQGTWKFSNGNRPAYHHEAAQAA